MSGGELVGGGEGAGGPVRAAHAPVGLERCALVVARTIGEACEALARADADARVATVLAGGTDWIVDRHLAPAPKAHPIDLAVDVTRIAALKEIALVEREDGERRLRLGGGVTYWTLRTDPRVTREVPMLGAMAIDVGAVQIQTRGTLAGNVMTASPAADGSAALMALDAEIVLTSVRGERSVSIESFFAGYRRTVARRDEIVTAIDVRIPPRGAEVRWRKVGTRSAQAISKVALASVVELDGGVVARARFGMASVAAVTAPLRLVRAHVQKRERASLDRAAIDAVVGRDVTPIDDVRSTGEYRMHVARALVWHAVAGA